jgi:hypothetical protein
MLESSWNPQAQPSSLASHATAGAVAVAEDASAQDVTLMFARNLVLAQRLASCTTAI